MTAMPRFSAIDEQLMSRALQLAARGLYTTQPNPRVGCVIAHGATIVGEGWHKRSGEAHAEALALQQAGSNAKGATAYVTLEPHCHQSRTPPCTDALIRAGVARVISAMADPNPQVSGQGHEQLRAAGIDVEVGLLEATAKSLNAGFIKRMTHGLPWVTVKVASSLDGYVALASGESRWITGDASRQDVQRLRARSSAIITGINTVLMDDPQLTVRDPQLDTLGRQPLRVVIDSNARTPAQARLLREPGETFIYAAEKSGGLAGPAGAQVLSLTARADGKVDLEAVLKDLARRGCNEALVEAGPTLSGEFLRENLADELVVYVAPVLLGRGARSMLALPSLQSMQERRTLQLIDSRHVGNDIRLRLRPQAGSPQR